MKYRVEYIIVGAESAGLSEKEFEAETDEQASAMVVQICQERQNEINRGIGNRFWHYHLTPIKLVRIEQPEISHEIEISKQVQTV